MFCTDLVFIYGLVYFVICIWQICFQACVAVIAPAAGPASALSSAPGSTDHRTVASLALAYMCHSSLAPFSASASPSSSSLVLPSPSSSAALAALVSVFPAFCAALRQADRATVHAALVALRAVVVAMHDCSGLQQHTLTELAVHAANLLQCVQFNILIVFWMCLAHTNFIYAFVLPRHLFQCNPVKHCITSPYRLGARSLLKSRAHSRHRTPNWHRKFCSRPPNSLASSSTAPPHTSVDRVWVKLSEDVIALERE
jgi:hypothetical protein